MRPIGARSEGGSLKLDRPVPLREGESVSLIVLRHPVSSRWNLERLAATSGADDAALAEAGLDEWAAWLDAEDRRR